MNVFYGYHFLRAFKSEIPKKQSDLWAKILLILALKKVLNLGFSSSALPGGTVLPEMPTIFVSRTDRYNHSVVSSVRQSMRWGPRLLQVII